MCLSGNRNEIAQIIEHPSSIERSQVWFQALLNFRIVGFKIIQPSTPISLWNTMVEELLYRNPTLLKNLFIWGMSPKNEANNLILLYRAKHLSILCNAPSFDSHVIAHFKCLNRCMTSTKIVSHVVEEHSNKTEKAEKDKFNFSLINDIIIWCFNGIWWHLNNFS